MKVVGSSGFTYNPSSLPTQNSEETALDAVVSLGSCVGFGETGGKSGGGNLNLVFYLSFPVINLVYYTALWNTWIWLVNHGIQLIFPNIKLCHGITVTETSNTFISHTLNLFRTISSGSILWGLSTLMKITSEDFLMKVTDVAVLVLLLGRSFCTQWWTSVS